MNKILCLVVFSFVILSFSCVILREIGKNVGFGVNTTLSQPFGIYAYFPIKNPLQKGDLVDCCLDFSKHELQWIKSRHYVSSNQKLLKNIAAMPGDWLFTVYPNIYVCKTNKLTKSCALVGSCLRRDKNGLPLFCQIWHGKKVPNNYFYLQSSRVLNSFDSRYFGFVHIKNIYHRLRMIMDLS